MTTQRDYKNLPPQNGGDTLDWIGIMLFALGLILTLGGVRWLESTTVPLEIIVSMLQSLTGVIFLWIGVLRLRR